MDSRDKIITNKKSPIERSIFPFFWYLRQSEYIDVAHANPRKKINGVNPRYKSYRVLKTDNIHPSFDKL